jgi:hypothetical protein
MMPNTIYNQIHLISIAVPASMRRISTSIKRIYATLADISIHKRIYLMLAILALSIVAENFWLIWEGNETKINPYPLLPEYHIPVQWYWHYLCIRLGFFVASFSLLTVTRMRQTAKIGVKIFIFYRAEDVISYLLFASQISYTIVLSVLLIAAIFICYKEFDVKSPVRSRTYFHDQIHQPEDSAVYEAELHQ